MKIAYVGNARAVEIAASGQLALKGEAIEVEDSLALSLLEQKVWEARSKAPKTAPKPKTEELKPGAGRPAPASKQAAKPADDKHPEEDDSR